MFPVYSIGHFINEPDNPTEFEMTRFETMAEPNVEDPHKHTFYEILWVEEGRSRQTIDYQSYDVDADTLFFISPGQVHLFEEWQQLKGACIMFTEGFLLPDRQNSEVLFELSFLDNLYMQPLLRLSPEHNRALRPTFELLCREKTNEAQGSTQIQQLLLQVLLLQIQRCFDDRQPESLSKNYLVLFKRLKKLLDIHFTENLPVATYADWLHITPHHLNVVVKSVTGKTAGTVIRQRNLLEARRLLTYTDQSITDIAFALGYADVSYFARAFKKETGSAPLQFRARMSEKYRNL